MKGTILDFSIQTNSGIISGDDSIRYNFVGSEWKENAPPQRGMKVDFDLDGAGQAVGVYKALGSTSGSSSNHGTASDKAEESYNPFDWFMKGLKNYANFNGRARRKEFWFFYLGFVICTIIGSVLDAILGTELVFWAISALALTIPFLAVSARRLHDINKSGWWYLLTLTGIGIILLIIWWATEGNSESNPHGEPAK